MRAIILICLCCTSIFSQKDSLVRYNINTKTLEYYSPVLSDTAIIFDNTGWNYGSRPGFQPLSLASPENTFPGSGFTDYMPAHNLYQVNDYPLRTAVKIFFINNDSIKQKCSGLLVEKKYVLTACHCVGAYDSNQVFQFQDSVLVMPAYDNGQESEIFGKSRAVEYYTFSSNIPGFFQKDIALIKLADNLGEKTGWMGIGFSEDTAFYENSTFHKLSYPGTIDLYDSSRIFNGDTLYYNYGKLDYVSTAYGKPGNSFGYNINGVKGQSGSSLFYTNNTAFYSMGILVFSRNSSHTRITPEIFYSFKSVLSPGTADVNPEKIIAGSFYLSDAYPNPFNPATNIDYYITEESPVSLVIYNSLGQQAAVLVNETQKAGFHSAEFNAMNFPSGIYYFRIIAGKYTDVKKAVLIK